MADHEVNGYSTAITTASINPALDKTPSEFRIFEINFEVVKNKRLTVQSIGEDSHAAAAIHIKPGHVLETINGDPIVGKPFSEVIRCLVNAEEEMARSRPLLRNRSTPRPNYTDRVVLGFRNGKSMTGCERYFVTFVRGCLGTEIACIVFSD